MTGSPPSRAAWIEMLVPVLLPALQWSPPSRAAWIEICIFAICGLFWLVAAFTGGVD